MTVVVIDTHERRFEGERLFEYALFRDKHGEASGVFRVPKTCHYSVKMMPGKYWLKWRRMDWYCFTDKELEEISEAQFESYKEFGLKEFRVRKEGSPKQNRAMGNFLLLAALAWGFNSVCIWMDWLIVIPEAILVNCAILGISYSVYAVLLYRVKKKE